MIMLTMLTMLTWMVKTNVVGWRLSNIFYAERNVGRRDGEHFLLTAVLAVLKSEIVHEVENV